MKRSTLFTMILASGLTAQAADYQYLNIEKTDGTAQQLAAVGLTISYSANALTATNGTQTATIALSELSRMYFTNTQVPTGINNVETALPATRQTEDGIYNLKGQKVAELSGRSSLRKGIYIIRENGQSTKIQVK